VRRRPPPFLGFVGGVPPLSLSGTPWPARNWQDLVEKATAWGVAPLLYSFLRDTPVSASIPPDGLRLLKSTYLFTAHANANLYRHLQCLLDAFSHHDIPAIVLKGAALAELVYPNKGLRPMGDLDLLLNRHDLDRAELVVRELGYFPNSCYASPEWYRQSHHHLIPYVPADFSLSIELHQHIVPRAMWSSIPVADLWARARSAQVASRDTLVLSPEDQLLHTSLHVSSCDHFLGMLRSLYDIAFVVRTYAPDLNWSELNRRARLYGIEKNLYYVLWAAQSFVGAQIPATALVSLRDVFPRRPAEEFCLRWIIHRALFRGAYAMPAWIVEALIPELLGTAPSAVKFYRLTMFLSRNTAKWLIRQAVRRTRELGDDGRKMGF